MDLTTESLMNGFDYSLADLFPQLWEELFRDMLGMHDFDLRA
jgi:uncharacterized protein YjeT (DUF2065 family)